MRDSQTFISSANLRCLFIFFAHLPHDVIGRCTWIFACNVFLSFGLYLFPLEQHGQPTKKKVCEFCVRNYVFVMKTMFLRLPSVRALCISEMFVNWIKCEYLIGLLVVVSSLSLSLSLCIPLLSAPSAFSQPQIMRRRIQTDMKCCLHKSWVENCMHVGAFRLEPLLIGSRHEFCTHHFQRLGAYLGHNSNNVVNHSIVLDGVYID